MVWQYIIGSISAFMLFGFILLGCLKYGLLSCYSAYAAKWHDFYLKLNFWSVVTAVSALLMVPVLLEQSEGNQWQFLGFLAPVFLTAVAASPNYASDSFQWWMHQIGAWTAVLFITLYIFIIPKLLWIVIPFTIIAIALSIWKKGTWMFWAELAVYLTTYVVLFITI